MVLAVVGAAASRALRLGLGDGLRVAAAAGEGEGEQRCCAGETRHGRDPTSVEKTRPGLRQRSNSADGEAMRWLKHMLTVGLLLAAAVVALATVFSDHSDDYGKVALPSGGVVHLPKGTVTVFYSRDGSDVERQRDGPRLPGRPGRRWRSDPDELGRRDDLGRGHPAQRGRSASTARSRSSTCRAPATTAWSSTSESRRDRPRSSSAPTPPRRWRRSGSCWPGSCSPPS